MRVGGGAAFGVSIWLLSRLWPKLSEMLRMILAVSIVGIPLLLLVPFAIAAFLIVMLIGFVGAAYHVGLAFARRMGLSEHGGFLALAVGVLVVMGVTLVGRLVFLGLSGLIGMPIVAIAAKNRPLEERCLRAHPASSEHRPELSRAQVQAEARDAARRGDFPSQGAVMRRASPFVPHACSRDASRPPRHRRIRATIPAPPHSRPLKPFRRGVSVGTSPQVRTDGPCFGAPVFRLLAFNPPESRRKEDVDHLNGTTRRALPVSAARRRTTSSALTERNSTRRCMA